jgi:hypothetical protein
LSAFLDATPITYHTLLYGSRRLIFCKIGHYTMFIGCYQKLYSQNNLFFICSSMDNGETREDSKFYDWYHSLWVDERSF